MSTMAESVIAALADNRPPRLEKSTYNSLKSRMLLYIQGKEHGKDLLDSVLNGPFQYEMIEVHGTLTSPVTTRQRTYDDLTDKEKIREEYDIRATNIVLQKLSVEERESKLYNEFDRLTSKKGETVHSYYLRFAQLINDMNTIGMTIKKLQMNTKFVNNLQPEWSKFVTDVKLAKDMYESSFDKLYAYLKQHEVHVNEVQCSREIDSWYACSEAKVNANETWINKNMGNSIANQTKVFCCYNYTGEGHMARQCTQPKRPKNSKWFKEKMLLAQALEAGVTLDKE
nr:hypothetical protein [Tanacetum cinerariifolium]